MFDLLATVGVVAWLDAQVEHGGLSGGVFTQFGHLVGFALDGFLLLFLVSAFQFVALSLLPCLFFLALRKR